MATNSASFPTSNHCSCAVVNIVAFCQSSSDQVDLNNGSPGGAIGYWGTAAYNGPGAHSYLKEGIAILGELMGGQDMAEMDDRYAYEYVCSATTSFV